jgi:hypothetical protein
VNDGQWFSMCAVLLAAPHLPTIVGLSLSAFCVCAALLADRKATR